MILIADGGSTKADWILLDKSGEQVLKTRTNGLNPAVFEADLLRHRIKENQDLIKYKDKVTNIYFYGAGCGTDGPTLLLKSIFEFIFKNAKVVVKEDTYAAAYAVTSKPGIICILGTGSNSCYFDGKNVDVRTPSLGYVIMDEASGNKIGKHLLRDYFYNRMPKEVAAKFEDQFNLDADIIKRNIYKEDNPNTYLAHFAEFVFKNERNLYSNKLLYNVIQEFFEKRILFYKEEVQQVPVHFVGSVAFFARDVIENLAKYYMINIGNIIRRPIDGLIEYHREKLKLEEI